VWVIFLGDAKILSCVPVSPFTCTRPRSGPSEMQKQPEIMSCFLEEYIKIK